MEKIPVGILGATGTVGQKFVLLLAEHPWFEIKELAASERSSGKTYAEATSWKQHFDIPASIRSLEVKACQPGLDCQIVFSGLDSGVAGEVETAFARHGYWVFSNAKNHRMEEDVPLVIAELNPDHLDLISRQRRERGWDGAIITNANCSTIVLALSLAPLYRHFGLKAVQVVTMQAVSGAGYPGVASLDILGNVIPYIPGEEEKLQTETHKILGSLGDKGVLPAPFSLSAQCNRVPVEDGHLECVSVGLESSATAEDLRHCWEGFRGECHSLGLPSSPAQPVMVTSDPFRPQPRFDVDKNGGMSALVGRIRPCDVLDFRYVVLGHNTIRGAAGASVQNAELVLKKGLLD